MNKTITLITANPRKAESLQKVVVPYGYEVKITKIEFPEIQSNSTAEVAAFAAKWVTEKIKKPCVKMDSGFFVKEFGSFPGVYVRWVDEGLGAERFFDIAKNTENKKAMITCSVAYCEPGKAPVTFFGSALGHTPEKLGKKGSFIDRLFVPDEYNPENLTLGDLRESDPDIVTEIWGRAEKKFIQWLSERNISKTKGVK
jgi:XTP/dITP diphosphohydrolase